MNEREHPKEDICGTVKKKKLCVTSAARWSAAHPFSDSGMNERH
jgi:hypothetical protein